MRGLVWFARIGAELVCVVRTGAGLVSDIALVLQQLDCFRQCG